MRILFGILTCLTGSLSVISFILVLTGIFTDGSNAIGPIFVMSIITLFFAWTTKKLWKKTSEKLNKNEIYNKGEEHYTYDLQPASQYSFDYINSKGELSSRTVIFRSVDQHEFNSTIYLKGICTERHASRTFKAENMTNLVNLDTGECIDNPLKYFDKIYENENICA